MNLSGVTNPDVEIPAAVRRADAWVALCLALALHVVEEALTDFLSVYNPLIRSMREHAPWIPLPTFSFEVWLASLIVTVIALSSLTVFVLRGSRWMIPVSYVFAVLMFANGIFHLAGSVEMGRFMPGVYSAPLLLIAATYLLFSVHHRDRKQ